MGATERVRELVEPVVASRGLSLYDVEHAGGVLRIAVDAEGGVGVDALGELSRTVSLLLDEHDPLPGRYTLEVTSPGLERPLRTPAHFRGAVDSLITVRTVTGVEGDRRVRGRLAAADDEGITVEPDDGAEPRRLSYEQVERARTVFEWGPAPRPGKGGKGKQKAEQKTRSGSETREAAKR